MSLAAPKYFGTLEYDIHHIVVDNEVWFCGKDVGANLGYTNLPKRFAMVSKKGTEDHCVKL